MLELKGLEKTYLKHTVNEHRALRGIDLQIADGEFITVIGSNGAGKSTLFNAVAGTFFCERGRIVLDGRDITYVREHRRARQISRIFQDPMKGSAPGLTIAENIALAYARGENHLFSFALSRRKLELFRDCLAQLNMDLENRMNTRMGLLSGGQRQAVTLLMATIHTPRLLLLDEHTAALDPLTAERVLEMTRSIVAERNITTLMITHNINAALSTGSRTLMMEQGQIILDLEGGTRDAMSVPDLLAVYREKCGKALDNDRMLLDNEQNMDVHGSE
ncbi:MAG: ATP-binding cassette protein [Oscillospiraceae bacterium]|nr:ATP-binding cassette protein [Oscillospiraceae bacterium]